MPRITAQTVVLCLTSLALVGCKDDAKAKAKPATPAVTTAEAGSAEPAEAGGSAGQTNAADSNPNAVAEGGSTSGPAAAATDSAEVAATGAETGAETGGETTGDSTGGETTGDSTGGDSTDGETGETPVEEPPAPDPKKLLLDEVMSSKTKDDRAMTALAEAKTAGATPKELASAANKRGTRLFGTPDRAVPFFEYARDTDSRYADASFNLAKLAAMTGEIPTIIEHLTEVKKRGGKRLLQTVEYDPTFALVADDADVLALVK